MNKFNGNTVVYMGKTLFDPNIHKGTYLRDKKTFNNPYFSRTLNPYSNKL
jgi:hypothetical protein